MASSSSEEEMARFLPLDAGSAGALDLAGDFADDGPDSEEGRGRAGGCALTLPVKNVNDHIKKESQATGYQVPLCSVTSLKLTGLTSISRLPPSKRTRTRPAQSRIREYFKMT